MNVVLFTATLCPECRLIKQLLEKAKIPFIEKNIEEGDNNIELYMAQRCTTPTLVVDGIVIYDPYEWIAQQEEKKNRLSS